MDTSYPANPSAPGTPRRQILAPADACPECGARSQYPVSASFTTGHVLAAYVCRDLDECGNLWTTTWAVESL